MQGTYTSEHINVKLLIKKQTQELVEVLLTILSHLAQSQTASLLPLFLNIYLLMVMERGHIY